MIKLSETEYELALECNYEVVDIYGSRGNEHLSRRHSKIVFNIKGEHYLAEWNDVELNGMLLSEAREVMKQELAIEFAIFKEGLECYE